MQGAVREIALDVVRVDGSVLPCLLNAVEVRDDDGAPVLVRATLFEATARRRYERELLAAQRAAEESEARSRTLQQVVSDLAAATSVADVADGRSSSAAGRRWARGAPRWCWSSRAGAGGAARTRRCTPSTSTGCPTELLARAARGRRSAQLALELAQGVRTVPLDDRLRAEQPGGRGGAGRRGPVRASCVVPVTADSRRLGRAGARASAARTRAT